MLPHRIGMKGRPTIIGSSRSLSAWASYPQAGKICLSRVSFSYLRGTMWPFHSLN
jgi:hypothetical protein